MKNIDIKYYTNKIDDLIDDLRIDYEDSIDEIRENYEGKIENLEEENAELKNEVDDLEDELSKIN